mmetsp:Transcript_40147/g.92259  ORF Transcript_40147/g.92259 Transcript_40147/m.92259 type:complete len:410 (-) Transcript_40147:80-1309(-)
MQSPLQVPKGAGEASMLKEIGETPSVLRRLIDEYVDATGTVKIPCLDAALPEGCCGGKTPSDVFLESRTGNFQNKCMIIGAGSSWNVALLGEYLLEQIARIPVEVQIASEFRYRKPLLRAGDVLIVVSSSGETFDAVESVRLTKASKNAAGILTLAIVNQQNSTIGTECDACITTQAGTELGVASTKVFSSTALVFVLLAMHLGDRAGTLQEKGALVEKLRGIPDLVEAVIKAESKFLGPDSRKPSLVGERGLWDIACQNVLASNMIFAGRGCNFPIALEGAMKCKEVAYIHAEGYPAAEMKHGPIALIDQFMPVVFIAPRADPTYDKIKSNIEEIKTRNGAVVVITEKDNNELDYICEHVIGVPSTHEYLMPLLAVIPLQLLSFMMGVLRGNAVDNPRGLQKAHTEDH